MSCDAAIAIPADVLRAFALGNAAHIEPLGSGHINTTYFVRAKHAHHRGEPTGRPTTLNRDFILQRINAQVFPDPQRVLLNTYLTSEFIRSVRPFTAKQWLTDCGDYGVRDEHGQYWRLTSFVRGALSVDFPRHASDARAAGMAFGRFQRLLLQFPVDALQPAIPRFLDLPWRLQQLDDALADRANARLQPMDKLIPAINALRGELQQQRFDALPQRVIHGDCKINNALLHARRGDPRAVIDLDTVMPGAAALDFGDLVRSATVSGREDDAGNTFQIELFRHVTRGYLREMGPFLTHAERDAMAAAPAYVAFMLAVRFITDFLTGDTYFGADYDGHNLDRGQAQLMLAERLFQLRSVLHDVIDQESYAA